MSEYKCVLLILFLTTSICAQQKSGTLKIKPYTFENDKKEKVDAEFGTLFVPENRSDPESNLIELAFVRFKSTAKNPGRRSSISPVDQAGPASALRGALVFHCSWRCAKSPT